MSNRIVFIDPRVSDYQSLIADLPAGTEVVVLDANRDGVEQIAQALQGKSNLDAIDIVSHGASGAVYLGSSILDSYSIAGYANQLADVGSHLGADGDILLYGCNVAAGDVGQAFINQLAQATGADVTASTNLTGHSALGGDWLLESSTGAIDAQSIQAAGFVGVLATTPTDGDDTITGTVNNETIYALAGNDNVDGGAGDDFIYGDAGADTLKGNFGNDTLYGGIGNDTLDGGAGNDTLDGGVDDDILKDYEGGSNTLSGGAGNDNISVNGDGGGTNNTLNGNEDNDTIYAQFWSNNNTVALNGGTGNDLISLAFHGNSNNAEIDAGAGDDVIVVTPSIAGSIKITTGSGTDQIGLESAFRASPIIITDFSVTNTGNGIDKINLGNTANTNTNTGILTALENWDGQDPFAGGFLRLVQNGVDTLLQGDIDGKGTYNTWETLVTLQNTTASDFTAANFSPSYTPITVVINHAATDITLSANSVIENTAVGTGILVGTINITDLDASGNSNVLTLTGTDASLFEIRNGVELFYTGSSPDFEDRDSYNITATSTDGTLTYSQNLTVNVTDVADDAPNTWIGTEGNDNKVGTTDNDTLYGRSGNDVLDGGAGVDKLIGGFGNDTLKGNFGDDKLYGGAGNDNLQGGTGIDELHGGDENPNNDIYAKELEWFHNAGDRLDGGFGDDTLYGDKGQDYLRGGAGKDVLYGGEDGDYLNGDAGDDALFGDAGDDFITDNDGSNAFYGGDGNDVIGGTGDQNGGEGNDSLSGIGNGFTLDGGDGDDILFSDATNSTLIGGAGNDRINLYLQDTLDATTNDIIATLTTADAGVGDDVININISRNYSQGISQAKITTGAGADTIELSNMTDSANKLGIITVSDFTVGSVVDHDKINLDVTDTGVLSALVGWDGSANPFDAGFLRLVQNGADTQLQWDKDGSASSNNWTTLITFEGKVASSFNADNFLPAYAPRVVTNTAPTAVSLTNAIIAINENSDTSVPVKVADIQLTDDGAGTNTITLSGADAAKFEAISDALYLKAGVTLDYETQTAYNVNVSVTDKAVLGSTPVTTAYALAVNNVSDPANHVINGTSGANTTLNGTAGDETINGLGNNDIINAGAGDDIVDGGTGNDTVHGGLGNDSLIDWSGINTLYGDEGNDNISGIGNLYGGTGSDTVSPGASTTITLGEGGTDLSVDVLSLFTYLGNAFGTTQSAQASGIIVTDFKPGIGGDKVELNNQFDDLSLYLYGWDGVKNPFDDGYFRLMQNGADTELQLNWDGAAGGFGWQTLAILKNTTATHFTGANFSAGYTPVVASNHEPVATPLSNQALLANTSLNYTLPSNAFVDPEGDALIYTATLSDGTALPSWLSFDKATHTFSGIPANSNAGTLNLSITASDTHGASTSSPLSIKVSGVVNGVVQDGYVAGADLYVDTNNNGKADPSEKTGTKTDANGNFAFSSDLHGTIIAVGGTNTDTNLPNNLVIKGAEGSSVINPITTLVQSYIEQHVGGTVQAAETAVKAALGINAGIDLMHFDPLAPKNAANPQAIELQKIVAQVVVLADLSTNSSTSINNLANVIATSQIPIDLTKIDVVTQILGTTKPNDTVINQIVNTNTAITHVTSINQISQTQEDALNNVNDAPLASNNKLSTPENTAIESKLNAIDVDSNILTYTIVQNPTHGVVSLNTSGNFIYTPAKDYVGADVFSFKANDGQLDSNTGTINLTIDNTNSAPVFTATANTLTVVSNSAINTVATNKGVTFTEAALTHYFTDTDSASLGIKPLLLDTSLKATSNNSLPADTNATGLITLVDDKVLGGKFQMSATDGVAVSSNVNVTYVDKVSSLLTAATVGDSIIVNAKTTAVKLMGGNGNDYLIGNNGNDTLVGGAGNDVLIGGAGKDTFIFNTALSTTNVDTLTDFTSGIDKIQLSHTIFKGFAINKGVGAIDVGLNSGNNKFIYEAATHTLYYDADGGAHNNAVTIAILGGSSVPVTTDFKII
ncbi:DUF4347 domain-containing protein [Crenothrix polyspora]|uniref:Cadherin domain-containing protein n=1 Tax=Crenothrix polyspora TaxID=360316 RepID=A0A1R4HBA5_9GAMM|nr:DUF4347 domain-containing protein [Crenothrix polyspora]SJM93542.1 hypothetical protein CRENPOLYSF1_440017 [Crenothrix polyspora]